MLLFNLGGQFTSTALGQSLHEQAKQFVESDETFQLLAEADPAFKSEATAFIQGTLERGESREDAYAAGVAWGREKVTPYLAKYLPRASDSTVIAFAAISSDILRELQAASPSSCVAFMFGSGASAANVRISNPLQTRMTQIVRTILREGLRSPQPLDSAAGQAAVLRFAMQLMEAHGEGALADLAAMDSPQAAMADPAKICATAVNMYSTISQMPPDQGGRALRFVFCGMGR
jgi:hypothetical protein